MLKEINDLCGVVAFIIGIIVIGICLWALTSGNPKTDSLQLTGDKP